MRTYQDIEKMAEQDYSIGLTAHYKPFAQLVKERNYKTVIEVGTAYAGNAFHLLSNTDIMLMACIDPYLYYPAMPGFTCQEEYDILYEYAKKRLSTFHGVSIIRKDSKEACKILTDRDIIFLDGSHEYEDVKWELENYSKLVKPGGCLSGHDYNIFEGVNKAVDEFCYENGLTVNFLDGNIWYINY